MHAVGVCLCSLGKCFCSVLKSQVLQVIALNLRLHLLNACIQFGHAVCVGIHAICQTGSLLRDSAGKLLYTIVEGLCSGGQLGCALLQS